MDSKIIATSNTIITTFDFILNPTFIFIDIKYIFIYDNKYF